MTPTAAGVLTAVAVALVAALPAHGADVVASRRVVRRAELLVGGARRARSAGPGGLARLPVLAAPLVVRLRPGRHRRIDAGLAPLLEHVARELRAGSSLTAAVAVAAGRSVAEGSPDAAMSTLADDLRHGVPLAVAVADWTGPSPGAARRLAGTALAVAAGTGGATAVVIDGVADTLRDRVALDREVAALSSQARASALLLVVAPLVVAALAASGDARIAHFLLGTPLGWGCIVGGLALDAAGAAWMRLTIEAAR